MNKKLLLASLLTVGMLVSCGGGTTSEGTTSEGTTSEGTTSEGTTSEGTTSEGTTSEGTTSEDTEEGFGEAGYYLFGTGTLNWNNSAWMYKTFKNFHLTDADGDGVYSAIGTVTEDMLTDDVTVWGEDGVTLVKTKGWNFKVREYDGQGNITGWYPDGIDNNGVITAAGTYRFDFNPNSTAKAKKATEAAEEYTLFTTATAVTGVEAPVLNILETDDKYDLPDVVKTAKITIKYTDTLIAVPEGYSFYLYSWNDKFLNGWAEFAKDETDSTKYVLTLEDTVVGVGPLSQSYEGCIVLAQSGQGSAMSWDVADKTQIYENGGNFSFTFSETKTSHTKTISDIRTVVNAQDAVSAYNAAIADTSIKKWVRVTGTIVGTPTINTTYNSLNGYLDASVEEDKYEEATGLEAFAEGTTYYTLGEDGNYVEVAADATFDAGTTYYTKTTVVSVQKVQIYSVPLADGITTVKEGAVVTLYGCLINYKGQPELSYKDSASNSYGIVQTVKNPAEASGLYLKGTMNSWADNADYALTRDAGSTGAYTLTVALAEGDEFKVANSDWSKEFNAGTVAYADEDVAACFSGDGNITVATKGTYTFTYTPAVEDDASTEDVDESVAESLVISLAA